MIGPGSGVAPLEVIAIRLGESRHVDPSAAWALKIYRPSIAAGHFGVSGLPGQYFDLVKIQFLASSPVAKSPTRESGPCPVITETNHRPLVITLASNRGKMSIDAICAMARQIATHNSNQTESNDGAGSSERRNGQHSE